MDDPMDDDPMENEIVYTKKRVSKKNDSHKSQLPIYFGIVMIITGLLIGLVLLSNKNNKLSNKLNKQDATENINQITINIINSNDDEIFSLLSNKSNDGGIYNLSETQINNVYKSFQVFDKNSDGVWSVNEHNEYVMYYIETSGGRTNNVSVFNKCDIDGDNIVSFRELVYILTLLNESSSSTSIMTKNYINSILIPHAIVLYSLEDIVSSSSSSSSNNFNIFEYIGGLLMSRFDIYGNGYISYNMYITKILNDSFIAYDLNGDNIITFNEYLNSTFSLSGLSYLSLLTTNNNNNNNNITMNSFMTSDIINLNIDKELFLSTNNNNNNNNNYYKLNQCPNMQLKNESFILNSYYSINNNSSSRRRMWNYECIYKSIIPGACGTTINDCYCDDDGCYGWFCFCNGIPC